MNLDAIRRQARPFPAWTIEGVTTAACFFCAGFLGANVEVHLVDTYATVLGFDLDAEKIAQMREAYPARFVFKVCDAYAELDALQGRRFDLVTADPQLNQMERCFDLLPKFRAISSRLVLGISDELRYRAHEAGAKEIIPRAKGSWWAVW